jgi:hypothetical protein
MVRFVLYDALDSLARGNPLVKVGDMSWGCFLEGAPHVCCVFGAMLENGWISRTGLTPDGCPLSYYRLSEAGRAVLAEGRAWYRAMPAWRRALARIGLLAAPGLPQAA